jgi:hypothetical protein
VSERSRERLWHVLYPNKPYRPKGGTMPIPDINDITRAELVRELALRATDDTPLTFRGYHGVTELADAVVNAVKERAPFKDTTIITRVPLPRDTVTFEELAATLRRLGYDYATETNARRIYKDIVEHREPAWKVGDIVRSATNTVFTRLSGGAWMNQATQLAVKDEYPQRPLTKIGHAV